MDDIKINIAKNIAALRKHCKMTQLELAEKINYSDKAISRWESGDVTPDIETLQKLSIIFNVSLTKLFDERIDIIQISKEQKQTTINKMIIALLAITLVWTAATIVYVYSMVIDNKYNWKIFIYALPATLVVTMIFNLVWGKKKFNYVFISALVWTILLSIYIKLLSYHVWAIFIIGAPFQVAVVLWSKLRK